MVKMIVRELEMDTTTFGTSDYVLLDTFDKAFLKEDDGLNEEYDPKKHRIMKHDCVGKNGHRYVVFFPIARKK